MHLFFSKLTLVLVLLGADFAAASLHIRFSDITSVTAILAPLQRLSTEGSLGSGYHHREYFRSQNASANVESVDQMMQGLKEDNLWNEVQIPLLDTLSEHWRWIVYLVFIILLILVFNSILMGRRKTSLSLASENHHNIISSRVSVRDTLSQGLHDALTGLPNRTLFLDRLQHAININSRNEEHLAVVIIDLDQFKRINDSLGHKTGDRILKIVSERFLEVVRKTDTIARLGGDEFIVLVQGFNEPSNVVPIAQKIVSVLNEPVALNGNACKISASVGISIYPQHGESSEDLLRRADLAMYKSKYSGDSILMYEESFNALAHSEIP